MRNGLGGCRRARNLVIRKQFGRALRARCTISETIPQKGRPIYLNRDHPRCVRPVPYHPARRSKEAGIPEKQWLNRPASPSSGRVSEEMASLVAARVSREVPGNVARRMTGKASVLPRGRQRRQHKGA
jgi:hypothetical protein